MAVCFDHSDTDFRATLADASLMGIFPLGDISMTLTPLDGGERYRISDMTLPATLDVPGFARMTLAGVEMQGTWSTARRSYSDLHMVLRGLDIAPADGSGGRIAGRSFLPASCLRRR